jgi:hypothetical protein
MRVYYYVNTFLTTNEWEEMIVSLDDPEVTITPRILIWPEGGFSSVEENPMYQVHYRKYFGGWEKVHYSFTYLPDHIVIESIEIDTVGVDNDLPPGYVWKDMK